MPNLHNRTIQAFHSQIASAAEKEFGVGRCPCCGTRMTGTKVRNGQPTPPSKRTIGHDFPRGMGGDARVWVYMCWRCNGEQGFLDLVTWSHQLHHRGDGRADRVLQLALFVRRMAHELYALSPARQGRACYGGKDVEVAGDR